VLYDNAGAARTFGDIRVDDLLGFFETMGAPPEFRPMLEALEAASPRLRSPGVKPFHDLLGREREELADRLDLQVKVEPRDYYPAE